MTLRVIKFKEKESERVNIVAVFDNVTCLNTEHFPRIRFICSDLNCTVEMVVPSDCYITVRRDVSEMKII